MRLTRTIHAILIASAVNIVANEQTILNQGQVNSQKSNEINVALEFVKRAREKWTQGKPLDGILLVRHALESLTPLVGSSDLNVMAARELLGLLLMESHQNDEAIKEFQSALKDATVSTEETKWVRVTLNFNKSKALQRAKRSKEAVESHQATLIAAEELDPVRNQLAVGNVHLSWSEMLIWDLEKYKEAESHLTLSLAALMSPGVDDPFSLYRVLSLHGVVCGNSKNHTESTRFYAQALALIDSRFPEDLQNRAMTLNSLALAQWQAKDNLSSEKSYRELLSLITTHSEITKEYELGARSCLGWVVSELGRKAEAAQIWKEASQISFSRLGPQHEQTLSLLEKATDLMIQLGDYRTAQPLLNQLITGLTAKHGQDNPSMVRPYMWLAIASASNGDPINANRAFQSFLRLRKSFPTSNLVEVAFGLAMYSVQSAVEGRLTDANEAMVLAKSPIYMEAVPPAFQWLLLMPASYIHAVSGRLDKAEECLEEIRRQVATFEGETPELSSMKAGFYAVEASLRMEQGRLEDALKVSKSAVASFQKYRGDIHPETLITKMNLAHVLCLLGRGTEAEPLARDGLKALQLILPNDSVHIGYAQMILGNALRQSGRPNESAVILKEALGNRSIWQFPLTLSAVLLEWAKTRKALNDPSGAIFWGKQSLAPIMNLGNQIRLLPGGAPQLLGRQSRESFTWVAEELILQGRLPEAQQVLTMMKQDELQALVRGSGDGDPRQTKQAFTGRESGWTERFTVIQGRLAQLGNELLEIRQRAERSGVMESSDQNRMQAIESDLSVSRQAFEAFLGDIEKESKDDNTRSAQLSARRLKDTESIQATLEELGHGAITLHYVSSADNLHIILTTPTIQLARTVTIKESELNRLVGAFRFALSSPTKDVLGPSKALYDVLLRPVETDLKQAGARTLMLSLDGSIRYVPFSALWDGKAFLVERFSTTILTEAAKDKLRDSPKAAQSLLGLGLSDKIEGFQPLPGVLEEMAAVSAVLPGKVFLNKGFTAEAMRQGLLSRPPVLHISSHFVFHPGTDAESFLLLGDGKHLSLREINNASWTFGSIELLTLSACDTAVGGGLDMNGREVEGLGAILQRKGAKGVLATLWSVNDASTGKFMASLYRRWKDTLGITKADALRDTQRAFILGGQTQGVSYGDGRGVALDSDNKAVPYTPDPKAPYAHPYYWAPFILMGNWR